MPLSNIRVIDASSIIAGPLIATNLGDFGADVIKIEHPKKGDSARAISLKKNDVPIMWKWLARNKRTLAMNLKDKDNQKVFLELVKKSDVVIENFRPGTLEKWGIGYEQLKKINPGIILVRVTGYGQTGPYANRPGFGTIAEAMSGFAQMTGFPDGPPILPPFGLADSVTALNGTYATMIALYHRDKTNGEGQVIDLSIVESMFAFLGSQASDYDALGVTPQRMGNRSTFSAPRNLYQTKDGKYVCLSGSAQSIAERIFEIIGHPELIDDPRFATNDARVKNGDELDEYIGNWIIEHDQDEVIARFSEKEAAIGPVYSIADIVKNPHFIAREMITEVADDDLGSIKMQNIVPRLSKTPGNVRFSGQRLGESNFEILKELGYRDEEIKAFQERNKK